VSLGAILLSAATAARAVTKSDSPWSGLLTFGKKEPQPETKAGSVDGLVGCSNDPVGHPDIGDDGDVYDSGDGNDGGDPGDVRDDDGNQYDQYLDYVDLQFEVETHPDLDVIEPLDTPPELDTLDVLEIHEEDTQDTKDIKPDGDSKDIEDTEDTEDIEEDEYQLPACWKNPDFGKPCEDGLGECKAYGVLICDDEMIDLICSATAFPPQPETCDGKDNNCSGFIDDGNICLTSFYCDNDEDSFISSIASGTCNEYECMPNDCVTLPGQDCDDNNELVNPFIIETCNSQDDNCDGQIDEGLVCETYDYYCDSDEDGAFSTTISGSTNSLETIPENCNLNPGQDCDDTNPNINPLAEEICNGKDENCNDLVDDMPPDEDYYPADPVTKGVGLCKPGTQICLGGNMVTVIFPTLPHNEVCDLQDNDCDDETDEDTTQIISSGFDYIGLCQPEIKVCNDEGVLKIEQPLVTPQFEACDGLDNDCDDVIDNPGACFNNYYCDEDGDNFFKQSPTGQCESFQCVEQDYPECSSLPGTDCDDTNPDAYPAAPAGQCIDVDFNCDGQVSFAKLTPEIRLSNDPAESWDPSVATNGNVFFITWKDNREGSYNGYYAMVSNDGSILVPETAFTTGASVGYGPKVEWNGSEFLVVWKNDNYSLQPDIYCFPELMFTKFDSNGTKVSGNVQIITTEDNICPSLSVFDMQWCSGKLAFAFWNNDIINFVKLDENGNKISNITTISDSNAEAGFLSLNCNNNGYGVAFEDHRDDPPGISVGEIYYAQVDNNGDKVGADLRITNNSAGDSSQNEDGYPAIACQEQECGIIWSGENWYKTPKFIRVNSDGSGIIGQEKIYEQSEYYTWPTMLSFGENYITAWTNQTPNSGLKQDIHMARLNTEGSIINNSNILNHPNFTTTVPSLALNETEDILGLGWTDGRHNDSGIFGNWETYFSIVGCQ